MNYKRLMAIVFIAAMLGMILPVLPSGAHVPCDAAFLVKVNGLTNWIEFAPEGFDPEAIILPELTYGLGSEFTVEVWILGVDDMFGYEFELTWTGDDYIELVDCVVEEVWPAQIVIKPDVAYKLAFAADGYYPKPYKQVVSAYAPSTGVSGDILLATLTFSIHTDICYCEGYATFEFNVENYKVSDSCTQEIDVCNVYYALAIFLAKAPDIMMKPNNETNSAIWPYDGKFQKEIWVSDVVKMKSLHFDLRWTKNEIEGVGFFDAIELEEVEFDKENLAHMDPSSGYSKISGTDYRGIAVDILIKCPYPTLRGTFRVMTLTFKKLDPWPCGRQPEYTYKQPHTWTSENATVKFWFDFGYFDVYCPGYCEIYFGKDWKRIDEFEVGPTSSASFLHLGDQRVSCMTIDAQSYPTILSGSVCLTNFETAGDNEVWFEIGLVNDEIYKWYMGSGNEYGAPTPSMIWNQGVYLIFLKEGTDWKIHMQDATGVVFGDVIYRPIHHTTGLLLNCFDFQINYTMSGTPNGYVKFRIKQEVTDTVWSPWTSWAYFYHDYMDGWIDVDLSEARIIAQIAEMSTVYRTFSATVSGVKAKNSEETIYLDCYTSKWYDKALYKLTQDKIVNLYTFMPVPGDLNRDGVVDVVDVMIIAQMYGETDFPAMYYDFNNKDGVDIFDIVVITKNFGRASP